MLFALPFSPKGPNTNSAFMKKGGGRGEGFTSP